MAARPANAVSGGFSGSDKKKKKRSGAGSPCVYGAVWNAKFQQRRVRCTFGNEFRKIVLVLSFSGCLEIFVGL